MVIIKRYMFLSSGLTRTYVVKTKSRSYAAIKCICSCRLTPISKI